MFWMRRREQDTGKDTKRAKSLKVLRNFEGNTECLTSHCFEEILNFERIY